MCTGSLAGAPDGSTVVATLAQTARPRYHVAACSDLFHQRAPYMNRDLGTGSHATRFISLAAVGNAAKAKWAHALQLAPCGRMPAADLTAKPADATASPYSLGAAAKRAVRVPLEVLARHMNPCQAASTRCNTLNACQVLCATWRPCELTTPAPKHRMCELSPTACRRHSLKMARAGGGARARQRGLSGRQWRWTQARASSCATCRSRRRKTIWTLSSARLGMWCALCGG